ncbi:hypothetical protein FISHEDRAFT_55726 [Fistulina hepatica ATCC 64428]|uniref:Anaphase-promoting complex subunit 4 n=1 Tax=Fistulina hepatica ATCC 64428 TaxID=1128425 RepID=A0A0D7AN67_9AGAR|nr:hypothetical protein FISHEDRAFT_55726 [Fistulina hepatica ATCC 64428]
MSDSFGNLLLYLDLAIMGADAFVTLAKIAFPSPYRLLPEACCPDKDLVVLISRLGGQDKMSLWKIQGAKKWEVDVGISAILSQKIVGIAWGPDGQSIAVAHDPPRISLHSLQNGQEEKSIAITDASSSHLTGIWWFKHVKPLTNNVIPDIFKRNDVLTGSALSVLKMLPLLDHLQQDSQKTLATDIFAFQGSSTHARAKTTLPEVIQQWPSLPPDPLTASMSSATSPSKLEGIDDSDDTNKNSILATVDDIGTLRCYLDGTYPLGSVKCSPSAPTPSLFKHPKNPNFLYHPQYRRHPSDNAVQVELQLLRDRKEMRDTWFGSDGSSGARDLALKWTAAYSRLQKQFISQRTGPWEPRVLYDLRRLLLTGVHTETSADFFSSGDTMTDRSVQKWEATMIEALTKMRDYSEKRIAPACQRLHLILSDILGWSQFFHFDLFELDSAKIRSCMGLAARGIVLSNWLASTARQELSRFKEFIAWLQYELSYSAQKERHKMIRHDILEVDNYFTHSLLSSSIDKWFTGDVPVVTSVKVETTDTKQSLSEVLERARIAASASTKEPLPPKTADLDREMQSRNLHALMPALAEACERIFERAASATARSAAYSSPSRDHVTLDRPLIPDDVRLYIRERVVESQYLAMGVSGASRSFLCLVRQDYDVKSESVGAAVTECFLPEVPGEMTADLVAVDFFDDTTLVVVYRNRDEHARAFIGTVDFSEVDYRTFSCTERMSREMLAIRLSEQYEQNPSCRSGPASLALNGRVGRRVACVMDGQGMMMETLDLEGEGEGDVEEGKGEEEEAEDLTPADISAGS